MGRGQRTIARELRSLSHELLLTIRTPADCVIDPTGQWVAFSLLDAASARGATLPAKLWLAQLDGTARQLTSGPGRDRLPRWSPDGAILVFASDRRVEGVFSPYLMRPAPAGADTPTPALIPEAVPVGDVPGTAEHIAWASDGRTLLVLAADPGSDGGEADVTIRAGAAGEDPQVFRPRNAWRRLFTIDIPTGDTREVGPDGLSVWEVDWHGGDRAVAIVSGDPSGSGWYATSLAVLDLAHRTARSCYAPKWPIEGLRLSPDGTHAAIVEGYSSDRGLLAGSVTLVELASGKASEPSPHLQSVSTVEWHDPGSLWYVRWNETGTAIGRMDVRGGSEELWAGEMLAGDMYKPSVAAWPGGQLLATVVQAHGEPPEVAVFAPRGERSWRRITTFNADVVRDVELPRRERLEWRAGNGPEIKGLLLHPTDGGAGPAPLVALVHGGPSWCWNSYFNPPDNALMLASAGYAVLLPNPRGGNGRSHKFAQSVIGDPGGGDLRDILAGIDLCVERGIADPERIGIAGLSYGGFMSAWAPTQTDRFKAAVAVSCVSNWVSHHNTTSISSFDGTFLDSDWRDPGGAHHRLSPIFHAHRSITPTLVIHGELDTCTPLGQAQELYAALIEAGVETELVVYPREGHWPVEREHQIDYWTRMRDWFDRYLRP